MAKLSKDMNVDRNASGRAKEAKRIAASRKAAQDRREWANPINAKRGPLHRVKPN